MRTRAVVWTLVCGMLALSACSATSGTASPMPTGTPTADTPVDGEEWILYQTSRASIGLVRPDGTGAFPIATDAPKTQSNPSWDPTGTRVAFVASDDGTDDLWTVGADDTDAKMLLECAAPCVVIDDPAWSPDGTRIAFSRTVGEPGAQTFTLETVDVASGATEVILGPWETQATAGATWSPDSTRIAFELLSLPSRDYDTFPESVTLTVVSLDDPATLHALTDPQRYAETADWSPDGATLVFGYRPAVGDADPDLYTVSPDGGEPVRLTTLTDDGGFATHPFFSPDGSRVVFAGQRDPSALQSLLVVDLATGAVGPAVADLDWPGWHPQLRPIG